MRSSQYRSSRCLRKGVSLIALILTAVLISFPAFSQVCRVLDRELHGSYEGACKEGLAEGYGVAKGMAEYRGQFQGGKKHGKGVKTWPWGDRYEGDFVEDRKEGRGIFFWSLKGAWAGERYEGAYFQDVRTGIGKYFWPTGDAYSGLWRDDQMVGPIDPVLFDRFRAHARADTEARIAVARVGTRVCRSIVFGIGEREWIRGVVAEVSDLHIAVRIEEPGRSGQSLNEVSLVRGAQVWDDAPMWAPCL